jgi:DNA polymerase IV (DinB-like DNA polymerase)
MDRWIMHVDMDAFFASVEQFRNHVELQGRPVCVGPDPKNGLRGVVRSASYEARAFGIKSGMPVSAAQRLCPHAVFVSGQFPDYVSASDELMEVLRRFADGGRVRKASIDEAYIEVTFKVSEYPNPVELARDIQRTVRAETSLPCSIGVAPNMAVAKVATGRGKPNGITLVNQGAESVAKFLAPLDVRVISGVGEKTGERLRSFGIEKLGQIQKMSIADLWPAMGRASSWLHQMSFGTDERPLFDSGHHVRGSISKDCTFMEDVDPEALELLHGMLKDMCTKIADKLSSKGLLFRTATVKIRYKDYTTVQTSKSLPVSTDSCHELNRAILDLFDHKRRADLYVRLLGVRVSSLSEKQAQTTLFQFL